MPIPSPAQRPFRDPTQHRTHDARRWCLPSALLLAAMAATPSQAQDVRGLELCTAEKQMERRTSCLQANTDFLQGLIERNARDTRQKLDAAGKALAAARTEIDGLKAALAATRARLDKLEKAEPGKAREGK